MQQGRRDTDDEKGLNQKECSLGGVEERRTRSENDERFEVDGSLSSIFTHPGC